ncbi:MAG: hypothetical protein ACLFPX_02760 [Candidatus Omnitrophota bacterium]
MDLRVRGMILAAVCLLFSVQIVSAQLINYGRRNKYLKGRSDVEEGEETLPEWVRELPRVINDLERRYDVNRDGLLQTAEVKVFLRDVIDEVSRRNRIEIETDILKEYDKNNDRMIELFELERIRKDVQNL